ncbi:MAG: acyltransferase family protein [Desulfovibrio sp.]|nr:acyltransferase family protein [Desulfovibrio sp.]MBI4958245.1 acyltransferase family protein [Desulfovibrio sp.]
MFFIDNLRLTVIVLVVVLHVAVTYSGLGDWYYKEGRPLGTGSFLCFLGFQAFLQAFFMGALFMVAGYFAAASLKSKGAAEFLKGRAVRLGVPSLAYMLAINPATIYYLKDWDRTLFPVSFSSYWTRYVLDLHFIGGSGPMWFAVALLLFCVVYALAEALSGRAAQPEPAKQHPFPALLPVGIALAASAGAFLLRLKWPIGSNVYNMQLGFFSQYVILFCVGIAAHSRGWFSTIGYGVSKRYLTAAFCSIPLLLALAVYGDALEGSQPFRGGMHWQSLAFAVWESFTGVFMSFGLVGFMRERWNSQGKLAQSMSASAFAVYVFHPPVLVFLSQVFRSVDLAAIPKFLLVSAVALPASFLVARVVRAIPVIKLMVRS